MKKVIAAVLSILLIVGIMPVALAEDIAPVRVSTLAELQKAIADAESGDTICVTQTIIVSGNIQIGEEGKSITLCGTSDISTLLCIQGTYGVEETAQVSNIIFDGRGMASGSKVIAESPNAVIFDTTRWVNCISEGEGAGLFNAGDGTVTLIGCAFESCEAMGGGALFNNANGNCIVLGTSFNANQAITVGGAIFSVGTLSLENCTFSQNCTTDDGLGGAVYGFGVSTSNCTFSGNHAQTGGAIYCEEKSLNVDRCVFAENDATSGGAIFSESETKTKINLSTITRNSARTGGGLYLRGPAKLIESKVYDNQTELSGKDLYAISTVEIQVEDYKTLYADELASKGYDSLAWYIDTEDCRYTEKALADMTSPLSNPSLAFIMWGSAPAPMPEPEPTPEPEPEPTPVPTFRPSHAPVHKPAKQTPIQCGAFELSRTKAFEYIEFTNRFVAPGEKITRGQVAYLIYCFSPDERTSQMRDAFADISVSPYRDAINELAAAKVFVGQADGAFNPEGKMSVGQLLTVLTRFVEKKEMRTCCFAESKHWAAFAAQTACAYGWIPDVPIDLDAPATIDLFTNLLSKLIELK